MEQQTMYRTSLLFILQKKNRRPDARNVWEFVGEFTSLDEAMDAAEADLPNLQWTTSRPGRSMRANGWTKSRLNLDYIIDSYRPMGA